MGLSARFQVLSVLVLLSGRKVFKKASILSTRGTCFAFVSLVCFTSGCPPRMRRGDRHGDGALHPGRGRLRSQSLLLRLHPERNQVHLPQEVCTCSQSVTSQECLLFKMSFLTLFSSSTPASICASLLS